MGFLGGNIIGSYSPQIDAFEFSVYKKKYIIFEVGVYKKFGTEYISI